jgi:hypothetical protein
MILTFWIRTLLIAVTLSAFLFGFELVVARLSFPLAVYLFVWAFALLTIGIHNLLMSANEKSPQRFVTYFMGSVSVKLFSTLIFLFVYLYFNREDRIAVALSVFGTYVVFTALEVLTLYRKLSR